MNADKNVVISVKVVPKKNKENYLSGLADLVRNEVDYPGNQIQEEVYESSVNLLD